MSATTQSNPELSICVLHYNRWDLTKECLASIDTQTISCFHEKLLCDNASDSVPPIPPGWTYRRSITQRGNIGGQNFCFEQAQGEWVLFVANDVRLQLRTIANLWANRRGITQPVLWKNTTVIDNCGLNWKWPGYGVSLKIYQEQIPAFTGSCYLMKKNLWQTVGGFDESLISSHEDIDFSLRVRQRHIFIGCDPYAHVIHLGNATLKHTLSNTRQIFHQARVKILKKHYRGVDRLLRLAAVNLLDAIPRR